MGLLTLYSGLLLPWLGGALWLAYADSRFNDRKQGNRFLQAGYGFFLGYAVLFLAIKASNQLTGTVSWTGLMLFLLVFTASGGLAVWRSREQTMTSAVPRPAPPGTALKILTVIVSALMAIHLVFIAVEIFTLPVYPWDAWLVWVYRAKAWFLAGDMAEVVSRADWATGTSADIYTIHAWRYPLFVSVIPYWAALSLGRWSETLVNLPVLLAGLAIGMALYGQCREYGFSARISLTTCYLMYSIPLFGTHIALAGYADIWMAGFTGLGFIALIRGVILHGNHAKAGFQFVLGLLMILFGIGVKNEGMVWLLAALALVILTNFRLRVPVLIVGSALALGAVAFALGISHIELPLVGKLGMDNGRFVIPLIGKFRLEVHDIQEIYWNNFIRLGSWNLFWVLLAGSLILAFKPLKGLATCPARRTSLSFLLIFLATQLFIFGFTSQGLWANTYTAINRLPLHFVPALLFAMLVIARESLLQAEGFKATTGVSNRDT